MQLEVERKFRVPDHDPIRTRLQDLGAACQGQLVQADTYFAHPARDFAQTDEALRLRRVGDQTWITYKGPKLDAFSKTRRELELPLAAGPDWCEQYYEFLNALGFRAVGTVHKLREWWLLTYRHLNGRSCEVEIALDQVERIGLFVELEVIAPERERRLAYETIDSLANDLKLEADERRSYLELLLSDSA